MIISVVHNQAFTLVELLVVLAIISILSLGAVTAISSVLAAGNINEEISDVSGLLEQARSYAMANNTYVYVGFDEVSNAQSVGGTPAPGVGRVVVSVVASTTGLAANAGSTSVPANSNITALTQPISKLKIMPALHLSDLSSVTTGNMSRTLSNPTPIFLYDDSSTGSPHTAGELSFTWPLNAGAAPIYTFTTVLQIDPQGEITFEPSGGTGTADQYLVPIIEIGLLQTHGTVVPTPTSSVGNLNFAALQIHGVTGNVQIYRP